MADVFLSYASADRARIAPLAEALAKAGFTLWWDRDIRPGIEFAETIEREIGAARAVVVVWSNASIRSHWVRDEATCARKEGKLIPLQIDAAEPPMGFRQIQAIDFRDWRGDTLAPAYASLIASVRELAARHGSTPVRIASKPPWLERARSFALRRRAALLAILALISASLAIWVVRSSSLAPGAHAIAMGVVEVQPFLASPPDPERAARAASYAAAFRQRLTELGIRNFPSSAVRSAEVPELMLVGELDGESGRNVLTAHIDDRKTGATLWSKQREPSAGAAWEANVAGFALKCALRRRDPALGTDVFSRYLYGCAHFLEGDFQALELAAKELYDKAPNSPEAIAFFAFAKMGAGWAVARSGAEHDRLIAEGRRLAERALQLDPHNADALFSMGFTIDDFQFAKQEQWWRRAIAADPELEWGFGRYSNFLTSVGRIREAIDIGLRAQLHRRTTLVPVARVLASTGDWQEAKAQYDLVRPIDPEQVGQVEMQTEVFYGDVAAVTRKLREQPALGGHSLECFGQILAARRHERLNAARFARDCGGAGEFSARAYAFAGDLDAAYRELELYLKSDERAVPTLFWPELRGFRRDRRFWPLAARMGLVDYWLDTGLWPDFCSEPDLPFDCKAEAARARVARSP